MPKVKPKKISTVMCSTNQYWAYAIRASSSEGGYTVSFGPSKGKGGYSYACSCPDFLWNFEPSKGEHVCKHIKAVKSLRCGWVGGPAKKARTLTDGSQVCPKCGHPVVKITICK